MTQLALNFVLIAITDWQFRPLLTTSSMISNEFILSFRSSEEKPRLQSVVNSEPIDNKKFCHSRAQRLVSEVTDREIGLKHISLITDSFNVILLSVIDSLGVCSSVSSGSQPVSSREAIRRSPTLCRTLIHCIASTQDSDTCVRWPTVVSPAEAASS